RSPCWLVTLLPSWQFVLCLGVMEVVWLRVLAVSVVSWIAYGSDVVLDIPQSQGEVNLVSVNHVDPDEGSRDIRGLKNSSMDVRDIHGLRDSGEAHVSLQKRQRARLRQLEFINSNMESGERRTRNIFDLGPKPSVTTAPLFKLPPNVRPIDCADLLILGAEVSGVYDIYPFTCRCSNKVQVYCDMDTDGGGWTVYLNRNTQSQREDFNRSWSEYKIGFGDRHGEYWLGTETLHALTTSRNYDMRLDIILSTGIPQYTVWHNFKVGSEDTKYRLSWGIFSSLDYSLTRNCLYYANGRSFSTYDVDEDAYSGNCAAQRGGGWWYYDCQQFNPTNSGQHLEGKNDINISCLNHDFISLDGLQLKVRPVVCSDNIKSVYLNYPEETCGYTSEDTTAPPEQSGAAIAPAPQQLALTAAPAPSPQLEPTAAPAPSPQLALTAAPAPSPQLAPTAAPAPSPQLAPTAAPVPSPQPGTPAAPVSSQLGITAAPVPPQPGSTAAPVPPQPGSTAAPVPPQQLGTSAAPVPPPQPGSTVAPALT
ncbi:hypothetical protein OTU49_017257, partial [Cherax quadricarinatus]